MHGLITSHKDREKKKLALECWCSSIREERLHRGPGTLIPRKTLYSCLPDDGSVFTRNCSAAAPALESVWSCKVTNHTEVPWLKFSNLCSRLRV